MRKSTSNATWPKWNSWSFLKTLVLSLLHLQKWHHFPSSLLARNLGFFLGKLFFLISSPYPITKTWEFYLFSILYPFISSITQSSTWILAQIFSLDYCCYFLTGSPHIQPLLHAIDRVLFCFQICKFLFIYLERQEGREKKREKNIDEREKRWLAAFRPDWGPKPQPGMCPDRKLNQRPFTLQNNAQPTEPHHPGCHNDLLNKINLTTPPFI